MGTRRKHLRTRSLKFWDGLTRTSQRRRKNTRRSRRSWKALHFPSCRLWAEERCLLEACQVAECRTWEDLQDQQEEPHLQASQLAAQPLRRSTKGYYARVFNNLLVRSISRK